MSAQQRVRSYTGKRAQNTVLGTARPGGWRGSSGKRYAGHSTPTHGEITLNFT